MKPVHNLIRLLRPLLSEQELAVCIQQLARDEPDRDLNTALCGGAELSPAYLQKASEILSTLEQQTAARLRCVAAMISKHAADAVTHHLLTNAWGAPPAKLANNTSVLNINIRDYKYSILSPGYDGYFALFEMLALELYDHVAVPVDFIYDLGAHIGVSAIYLHSLYPHAEIICVEPAPGNLRFLRGNLSRNTAIKSTVMPYAVSGKAGAVVLGVLDMCSGASMLNSAVFGVPYKERVTVDAIALRDLVQHGRYGIKVDIEGAEYGLQESADVISDAEWVLGEFHYGSFSKPGDRWFRNLLERNFDVTISPPRVGICSGCHIVSQNFQAFRK